MMFSIDHLGIAVKSLASSKSIYEKLGLTVSPEEVVEQEQVRLVMVPVGDTRLELLEPTSEDSTIAKFIAKRGEGLHHVCMKVPDLAAAVENLKREGVRLVTDEIKTGAGGHRYVFVHPSSAGGVLLELVEGHKARAMVLIGIDTSGKEGSLALARAPQQASSADDVEIVETIPLEGGTFSAQLIPQLAELLARHEVSKQDIDAFAVASGPGSFTGLRVGLAAVKGLAEALGKPIVSVSLLEAVAHGGSDMRTWAALDAGRNELYVAEYEAGVLTADERLIGRAEFVESAQGKVVTTDVQLVQALMGRGKAADVVSHPGSAGVARVGWEKLRAGLFVTPEELEANYIRRSDAELFSKA